MKERLRLFIGAVLVLAIFGLVSSVGALNEKEQLEKDYGDAYLHRPLDLPIIMGHGGPDPGGYYYIDSFDSALNAPDFDWTDISGIGVPVPLGDDQNVGPFPIGFDFTFYGVTFNQFRICSNGWISFTSTSSSLSNTAIPTATEPNNLIAIFWDDINPNNGGQVYYYSDAGANQLIVSYDGVPHYSNYGSLYFQAVLDGNDNSIVYHYGSMYDGGHGNNGATVGIENATGTIGTQYIYNQPGIVDSMAVYFGLEPPIFGEPGALMGTVTDLQMNPIEGAIVSVSIYADTTGPDGSYYFELQPLTYSATATAQYHNPVTVDDIVIAENETTYVDFALPTPLISVNTEAIQLVVDSGEVITVTRNVSNVGDGVLEFDVEVVIGDLIVSANPRRGERIANAVDPEGATDVAPYSFSGPNLPVITDYRDSLFVYMIENATGDNGCLGVEFDGSHFWVTGRNASGGDVHKLHEFDRDGNAINSYNQGTTTTWGWRDLAWDGEFLYASDENEFAVIDPAIGMKIGTLPKPAGLNPLRALAWDPATDHFWSANFGSNIYEFNRSGTIINQYPNSKSVYGMAWDDVSEGGPYIWINSQDGSPQMQISQFDPSTGTYTGETWQSSLPTGHSAALAGGACFTTEWDPSVGALVVLGQGTPTDFIYGYEIAPYSQWLIVDPMFGILQPAENVDMDITVDFTVEGLNYDSTYMANLIINNNTSLIPQIPVVINGTVDVDDDATGLPQEFSVAQNYPNPFNARTSISFALPEQSDVKIEVFNLLGQKTATIAEGRMPAGQHTVTWDASDVASGVYYYKISAGDYSAVRMMTLLK